MTEHNGPIVFTCCECSNPYTKFTGDVDERMCDECLNHEHEFGEEAYKAGSGGIISCIGYRGEE